MLAGLPVNLLDMMMLSLNGWLLCMQIRAHHNLHCCKCQNGYSSNCRCLYCDVFVVWLCCSTRQMAEDIDTRKRLSSASTTLVASTSCPWQSVSYLFCSSTRLKHFPVCIGNTRHLQQSLEDASFHQFICLIIFSSSCTTLPVVHLHHTCTTTSTTPVVFCPCDCKVFLKFFLHMTTQKHL